MSLFLKSSRRIVFIEWEFTGLSQSLSWTLILDFLALLFLSVVLFISRNVVWYSQSYLDRDKDANRFILLVVGFVVSICLLITSPNIVTILLGWDGLGLISYCLVIYYPTKKSRSAGILTVLRNRVGDICILFLIGWFAVTGDSNFFCWGQVSSSLSDLEVISLTVILAAITKRAQIPFSAWLPAAIAAPTPVSALVHSSTLVTAGVYLLIRFSPLLRNFRNTLLLSISCLTIFISGLVAFFEHDLKKVIALSTLSQLGVMIFAISLHLPEVAFFHMLTHALFKALLFLSAGAIIHGACDFQDLRLYGSLVLNFPLVGVCLNLANLSLCGLPFLAGFYSKDMIVELAAQGSWSLFLITVIFVSLGLTVAYSLRLVFFSLVTTSNTGPRVNLCDQDLTLVGPIVNLTLLSLFSGASLTWVMFPFPSTILLPFLLKGITGVVIAFSAFLAFFLTLPTLSYSLSRLSNQVCTRMWFLPLLRSQRLSRFFLPFGTLNIKSYDIGWLEHLSLNETFHSTKRLSLHLRWMQLNSLKSHFLVFFLWILMVFIF